MVNRLIDSSRSAGLVAALGVSVLLAGCGGSDAPLKAVELSEGEIAAVLVGAGLSCEDDPEIGIPAPGVEITRWDCVMEGSDNPYYDVFLYSGTGTDELAIEEYCSYLDTDAKNNGVLELNAANFDMYSNAAVEINEQLSSMEVATINEAIEPVLTAVGEGLGLTPQTPGSRCS
jgi:hypothetical protein